MLSENFSLREMTRSDVAERRGMLNVPSGLAVENMRRICTDLLEPLRAMLGTAIIIRSGYRSPDLNRYIGGSPSSQHCRGEAVDLEADGVDTLEVARAIAASQLPFDQLILECYRAGDPTSGWVHVSLTASRNRRQVLTATKRGGAWQYDAGLPG